MQFSSFILLPAFALVADAAVLGLLPLPSSQCQTLYGQTQSALIPTSFSVGTTACVTVSSITTTTTSTPAVSTSTVMTTQTSSSTAPVTTLTATSTVYSTQTVTATTTTTSTKVTAVDSTYTPTYTSSTTSGFIPVRSSLPEANSYSGSGGASPGQKRDAAIGEEEQKDIAAPIERRATASSSLFPVKVECFIYTASSTCSTQRVTSTSTVMAPVPTTTTTKTTTITSTSYPSATTTVTTTNIATSTTTSTSTVVTVSTTTNLIAAPTQTFYQICAEINFADTYQGAIINGIAHDHNPYSDYYGSTVSSAYQCCVNAYIHSRDSEPVGVWSYNPPSYNRVNQNENCNAYVQRAAGSQANGASGVAIYSQTSQPQGVIGNGPYGEVTTVGT